MNILVESIRKTLKFIAHFKAKITHKDTILRLRRTQCVSIREPIAQ